MKAHQVPTRKEVTRFFQSFDYMPSGEVFQSILQAVVGTEYAFHLALIRELTAVYLSKYRRLFKKSIDRAEAFAREFAANLAANLFGIGYTGTTIFRERYNMIHAQISEAMPDASLRVVIEGKCENIFYALMIDDIVYKMLKAEVLRFFEKLEGLEEFNSLTTREEYKQQKEILLKRLFYEVKTWSMTFEEWLEGTPQYNG